MFLNANVYTWSYRVAEWAWEEELAQQVADAIMDTSGGEASPISETAAEIGGLAAGSVLEALMLSPLALEFELEQDQAASNPDDAGDAQPPAAVGAAAIPIVGAAKSEPESDAAPSQTTAKKAASAPSIAPSIAPLIAPSVAPSPAPLAGPPIAPRTAASLASTSPLAPAAPTTTPFTPVLAPVLTPVADIVGLPAAAAPADTPRGRWVLKGYRTEIAFSVHTDPNKVDLAFQANEQSGAEIDNKARHRRPVATLAEQRDPARIEASRPWHDRGPEPE